MAYVTLKLTRVLMYSKRNNITKEYSQAPFPDKCITGSIEKDILDMIINMNLHVVKGLFQSQDKKYIGSNWSEDKLRTLFNRLATMTRSKDITVVGRAVSEWFDQIIPVILQTLTESAIEDTLNMYKKHGDMKRIRVIESIIIASIDKQDYNTLVNVLFDLNRVLFPNYAIGMLLCVVSELYVVFLDMNSVDDGMERDDVVVHILSSYLQKLLYEDDAYIINLKNYCDENNIFVKYDANIEKVVYKRIISKKPVLDMFTTLGLKVVNIERLYNRWMQSKPNERYAIYQNLNILPDFDILPYILTIGINDRFERLRPHIKIQLASRLAMAKPEIKDAILPYYAKYDEMFNHILFPNDGVGTYDVKTKEIPATETSEAIPATDYTINANRFNVGEFSMRSLLTDFITSGMVNKFSSAIVSAMTPQ